MIYVTSDLHFGHDREFLYKPRGFRTIQEHDEVVIERWNRTCGADDDIYVLGDLMLNDNNHGLDCLLALNGRKYIILGNHDTNARIELYRLLPDVKILGHADILTYKKYRFYLSHYPTLVSNVDDGTSLRARMLNLHGHVHCPYKFYNDIPWMYNVIPEAHNCTPILIDNIIEDMKNKWQECLDKL